MPIGPIMMGIGTVPAGVGTHVNGTFGFFGLANLFEPFVEFFEKDSGQLYSIQQYPFNETGKISLRGHESVPFAWYLSIFTVLIMFLLVISVAEVFCNKSAGRTNDGCFSREENSTSPHHSHSPPPYDLFGPPPYDTVAGTDDNRKKKMIEVFVVSIDDSDRSTATPAPGGESITTTPTKP